MNQSEMIGSRLKEERLQQKLTLKQLSEKVGLSIGYLSQVERGYGTLSLSALKKLSSALGLEMSAFFDNHPEDENDKLLVRSWQREELQLSRQFIQYTASFSLPNTKMRGLIFELQPSFDPEEPLYSHPEEEILYVLQLSAYPGRKRISAQPRRLRTHSCQCTTFLEKSHRTHCQAVWSLLCVKHKSNGAEAVYNSFGS